MKKSFFRPLVLLLVVAAGTWACSKYPGFKKTDSGLYYKIEKVGDDTAKPRQGSYVFVDYRLTGIANGKDTIILDSKAMGQPPVRIQIPVSDYPGDIYEGMKMMTKDDSATFIVNVDSLFQRTFRQNQRPPFLDSNSVVKFFVRLAEIQNPEDLKNQEGQKLTEYIKGNNITVAARPSGIFYIEKTAGNGPKIDSGSYVKLHFSVSMLDGKEIFSSKSQPEPFTFVYGQKFETKGFEEAVGLMTKGSVATVVVPSAMAFGENGKGSFIPPYATVVYNIEIIDVQTKAQHDQEVKDKEEKAKKEKENAKKNEKSLRDKYLKDNNIKVKPTASGLYYIEKAAGTGVQAAAGKTVSVHYTGTLLNGTKFDSSRDRGKPLDFTIGKGEVIKGWDEGISMMKKGGRATLVIPSAIAYGENGMGDMIPPFSTLVFDVELVDVK